MLFKMHVIDAKNPLQNYIWILEDLLTRDAIVVDPTEAQIVENYCQVNQLNLKQIWLTHWHKDHIDGAPQLTRNYKIPIFGPEEAINKISEKNHILKNECHFKFNNLVVTVLEVPGHTLGHIVFYLKDLDILFSGDTLFAMGCGRIFEGTIEQMYHSINRLKKLPANTKVYCAHEYTLQNAKFALQVDPTNKLLQARLKAVNLLRKYNKITLPTTIEYECQTNPFFRAKNLDDFREKRLLKDRY